MKIMRRTLKFLLVASVLMTFSARVQAETWEASNKINRLNNAHREMFAISNFSKLDAELNQIQLEYEKGQRTDTELWKIFKSPFRGKDPAFEALYNDWIAAYPKSYAAHQARALYYYNRVIDELNESKRMNRTLPTGAPKLKHYMELSIRDNTTALSLAQKPITAYVSLIAMHSYSGSPEKSKEMLDMANQIDPLNAGAPTQYMRMLEVSNGTRDEMWKVIDDVRKVKLAADDISVIANIYQKRLLADAQYERLDKEMNEVQKAYESSQITDKTLLAYFSIFEGPPAMEAKYNAWVRAYPRSYAARQARAMYFQDNALRARGTAYAKDTSDKQMENMRIYLKKSYEDNQAALSLTSKPILSYNTMLTTARLIGNRAAPEEMLEKSSQIAPENTIVRNNYMFGIQTRWGGSLEEMESFLKAVKASKMPKEEIGPLEDMIAIEEFWFAYDFGEIYERTGQVRMGF